LAERIQRVVRHKLAGRRAEDVGELIECKARELYPTVTSFLDHAGMVELLTRRGAKMARREPMRARAVTWR
jgi:hypothetical protein